MKNIKPIVQVMNLFSLVRINAAKSKVEEFCITSSVLTKIISSIMYNDNIVLDKNSIIPDPTKPVLNIYIASDYGFCSTYNQVVSSKIKETKDDYKIIIGHKINYNDDKVVMKLSKDNFYNDLPKIKDYLVEAVNKREFREINIYYNHYYNFSRSDFTCLQVFPVEYNEEYKENVDFLVETDIKSKKMLLALSDTLFNQTTLDNKPRKIKENESIADYLAYLDEFYRSKVVTIM